jgi:16S rRNA (uracil1498-N3)-methyltransferase
VSPRRFSLPAGALAAPGEVLEIPSELARHLEVLRLRPGDEIELTDGEGREAAAVLASVSKRRAEARVGAVRVVPAPPPPEVVLLQGVGKGEKLDGVVRQVAELGAARVVPVTSARAVARREGKLERLRAIAEDALRVSRGAWRTRVDPPVGLEEALEEVVELELAFLVGAERSLREVLERAGPPPRRVALLVGPEGGLSAEERDLVTARGFLPVSLGPRVLRTETAGPAAVAMVKLFFAG